MSRAPGCNPFYVLLLVAGVSFCVTACAYGVMMVRKLEPSRTAGAAQDALLVEWLAAHGYQLLVGELAVLGLATGAAIATDGWWAKRTSRLTASRQSGPPAVATGRDDVSSPVPSSLHEDLRP